MEATDKSLLPMAEAEEATAQPLLMAEEEEAMVQSLTVCNGCKFKN